MTAIEPAHPDRRSKSRLLRLAFSVVGLGLLVAGALVAPLWAQALFGQLSRSTQRRAILGFLNAFLVGYLVLLGLAVFGFLFSARAVLRARRFRTSRALPARILALSAAVLVGLALMEMGAAWRLAQLRAVTPLPTQFSAPKAAGEIHLVVVGESSAEGHPYHPKLSIGQIVAWGLEMAFPDRRVTLEMRASGGICLETAVDQLQFQKKRPDAILVFSGHNEFQARADWSRNAGYYVDDGAWRTRPSESHPLANCSPLCRVILKTIDQQRIDAPPPSVITRELADHPAFSTDGYEYLRSEFHRHVERLAAYCDQIDALPIMVVPASNDGRSPPYRSLLSSETPKAKRLEFGREFLATRAIERPEPRRAEASFRELIRLQPGFAESHYRLAQLLEREGRWIEANEQYELARDLDGFPMRCPSGFRSAYYDVARRHPSVLLIDAPRILAARTRHGILTFNQFHDPQHPTFLSYLALAQNVLDQLQKRGAFGWPAGSPSPRIDPDECARRFGLDRPMWAEVLERTNTFYARTAYIRYDPEESNERARILARAAQAVAAGADPDKVGVPGVGTKPTDFELDRN
jgi:hypothetical protein